MEPSLGAVSAYLAKAAGPKLAAAAQRQLGRRRWRLRLARRAFAELPRPRLRRHLAEWLEFPVNQGVLLSPDGPTTEAVEFLDAYLGVQSAKWGDLPGSERRRRTETVLSQVYDGVLREVDPSYAISIASSRGQAASAQTQAAVAEVKETVEEIRTVQAAAAARGGELDLRDRLSALPSLDPEWVVQRWREAPEAVWSAVTGLTQQDAQPEAVAADWQRLRPDWVVNAPVAARLAIAELAAGYGASILAADLFESAANEAAPRSAYWRARAAYIRAVSGDVSGARRALGASRAAGDTEPLARVVAARLDDDLPAVRQVIEEWEPKTAVETILRASLKAEALLTASDGSVASPEAMTAALKVLQEGTRRVPATTALRLVRASLLILHVRRGQSNHPDTDLRDARQLALSARDARRTWRGNSAEAAAVACEAANLAQDWQTTLKIGTVSEGGATAAEAAAADVRKHAAAAAAMTGNVELAEQLISSIGDFHVRALLTGQLAETRGEDAEPHYRRALDLADDDDQRRADALLALASVGATDVPGLEEFVSRYPQIRPEVEAARALAAGRRDEGIEHLRQVRRTVPTAALRLAQAYAEAGDTDGVVDTLRDAAADFRNPQLQLNAVQELLRAGRIPDAQAELGKLLTSGANWAGRADALRLAADLAARDGQLDRATELLGTALAERPTDPAIRWGLVQVLLERGDYAAAWRVFAEADPALLVTTIPQAHAWIELHRRHGEAEQAVRGSLRLIRQFPDDEGVAGHAIAAVFVGHREPLSEETLRDLHAAIDAFTTRWPDSTYFRRVSAEDAATLLQRMTELVRTSREEARYRREAEIALAYGQLPVGIASAMAGRSYAEVVVRRGLGRLHAQHPHPAEHRLDIEQARAALDGSVAVDTTAAAVLLALPASARRAAKGIFRRMVTTDSALRDASRGRDALAGLSTDTFGFDPDAGAARIFSIEPETAERMATEAELLVAEITAMYRRTPPPGHATPSAEGNPFDPWMPLLDLAKAESLPVWADDVALRILARQARLPAFSTPAVLAVLADTGRITGEEYQDARRALLAGRIGDAPLDEALLLEVAEEEGWKPGAAALALSSPASWATPNAFPIYRRLVHAAHRSQPAGDSGWLYSAIRGAAFAFAHQPETVSRIAGVILAWTIDATNAAGKPVAELVAAARQAIRVPYVQPPNLPDPLAPAVETLRDGLAGTLPAHLAAQYILSLFSELADHDKSMVARLILQPPSTPSIPGQ
jgi:tetratricopeptide (TPR) repeat protein